MKFHSYDYVLSRSKYSKPADSCACLAFACDRIFALRPTAISAIQKFRNQPSSLFWPWWRS